VANPPGAYDSAVVNSVAWRTAEIPAINGHGTARAVADFYHALSAGRLLSPGMLAEAITPLCSGPDRVFGHGGYTIGFVTGSVGNHDRVNALEGTCATASVSPPALGHHRFRPQT
jgi:hypothetical protein